MFPFPPEWVGEPFPEWGNSAENEVNHPQMSPGSSHAGGEWLLPPEVFCQTSAEYDRRPLEGMTTHFFIPSLRKK